MNIDEIIDKYYGKKVKVYLNNDKKITGTLNSYEDESDSERGEPVITVINEKEGYEILLSEIKEIK